MQKTQKIEKFFHIKNFNIMNQQTEIHTSTMNLVLTELKKQDRFARDWDRRSEFEDNINARYDKDYIVFSTFRVKKHFMRGRTKHVLLYSNLSRRHLTDLGEASPFDYVTEYYTGDSKRAIGKCI